MRQILPGVELPTWPPIHADLSNIEEVQAFAEDHEPSAGFLKGFHKFTGALCAPHVVFGEGAPERIDEHLHSGDPTLFVMTHFSLVDAGDAAAAIHQNEVLHPIEGRTVTQASADWFRLPGLDYIFYKGGASPVIREKDVRAYLKRQDMPEDAIDAKVEALKEERKDGNSGIRRLDTSMVDNNLILVSFIEGTRNRGDPAVVQPVKNGIKFALETIKNAERAKILVGAFDYGGARILPRRYLTPTMFFDIMDALPPDEINEALQTFMQYCADSAIENRREGVPLSPLGKIGALGAAAGLATIAHRLGKN